MTILFASPRWNREKHMLYIMCQCLHLVKVFGAGAVYKLLLILFRLSISRHTSGLEQTGMLNHNFQLPKEVKGFWSRLKFLNRCPLMAISKLLLLLTSSNFHGWCILWYIHVCPWQVKDFLEPLHINWGGEGGELPSLFKVAWLIFNCLYVNDSQS